MCETPENIFNDNLINLETLCIPCTMELSQLHEVQICYHRVNGPSGIEKGLEAP
jgi:hypothetical protein